MRVSAGCDYACRALLELSLHWPKKEPLRLRDISEKQDIPCKYLAQLLIQLRKLGLVQSVRGKDGGYNLAKSPAEIKLGEVIREISGPLLPRANYQEGGKLVFINIWKEVESSMAMILDKVTFEDIVEKAKDINKAVIYQI